MFEPLDPSNPESQKSPAIRHCPCAKGLLIRERVDAPGSVQHVYLVRTGPWFLTFRTSRDAGETFRERYPALTRPEFLKKPQGGPDDFDAQTLLT